SKNGILLAHALRHAAVAMDPKSAIVFDAPLTQRSLFVVDAKNTWSRLIDANGSTTYTQNQWDDIIKTTKLTDTVQHYWMQPRGRYLPQWEQAPGVPEMLISAQHGEKLVANSR